MKSFSLFFFLLIFSSLYGQVNDRFFLELNVLRYSEDIGMFPAGFLYESKVDYLNGFNIGVKGKGKFNYLLGLRKIRNSVSMAPGFSTERTEVKGLETSLGLEYEIPLGTLLSLRPLLSLFSEWTQHKGLLFSDMAGTLKVDNRKVYFGVAPELKITVDLWGPFALLISSRARLGFAHFPNVEETEIIKDFFPAKTYGLATFDPVHFLGLRLEI